MKNTRLGDYSMSLKEFDREYGIPTRENREREAQALRKFYLSHPLKQPVGQKPLTGTQLEQQAESRTAEQMAVLYPDPGGK